MDVPQVDGWTVTREVDPLAKDMDPETGERLEAGDDVYVLFARASLDGEQVELRFSPTYTETELRLAIKGGVPDFVRTPDGRVLATALPVTGYEDELRLIANRDDVRSDLEALA